MKRLLIVAAVTAAFAFSLSGSALAFGGMGGGAMGGGAKAAPANPARTDVAPDATVANVNGKAISRMELDAAAKAYMVNLSRQMGGKHTPEGALDKTVLTDILNQMVDRELVYQECEKADLKGVQELADAEYDKAKSGFPGDEEFQKALAAQSMDEKLLKVVIWRRFALEKYMDQKVLPTIKVTDEDAKKFYDENPDLFTKDASVRASHILVASKPTDDEATRKAAKEKAEGLQKKAAAGEDFAELAKANSDCPSSAQGGDLGAFGKGQMVKPFEEVAYSLEVGKISSVVETQFGYHVIKVVEKQEAGTVPLEEVNERITDYLRDLQANDWLKNKVVELKKDAKVEIVEKNI